MQREADALLAPQARRLDRYGVAQIAQDRLDRRGLRDRCRAVAVDDRHEAAPRVEHVADYGAAPRLRLARRVCGELDCERAHRRMLVPEALAIVALRLHPAREVGPSGIRREQRLERRDAKPLAAPRRRRRSQTSRRPLESRPMTRRR